MKHDIGLLILRLGSAGTMLTHGLAKINNYSTYVGYTQPMMGLTPDMVMCWAIFAEVFCAILVVLGLFHRLALIPLLITMATAFFVVHAADPFEKKELAFLYLVMFLALFLLGAGRFALQRFIKLPGKWSCLTK